MSTGDRLAGRSAVVTGGNSGIGLGIAEAFVRQGADVLIVGTNADKLAAAANKLASHGPAAATFQADVSDRAKAFAIVEDAVARFGKLDILVNGAAIYTPKPFVAYAPDEFARVFEVNVMGPFHLTQAALPHMVGQGYGKIVNIASSAGKWASRNQSAYNVSKHGLVGMTRCLALEHARDGITVNAICPGLVSTDMTDKVEREQAALLGTTPDAIRAGLVARVAQGRYLDVADCGHLAVYLASAESDGMTGQSIMLDGGMLFI
jgi:NAD(P)-dependent dehydrogenase (short-subunit alcohol dehydrogenase family)